MGIGPIRKHRLDRLAKQAAAKAEEAAKAAAQAEAASAPEQPATQEAPKPAQDQKRKH
jgi:hypothetical protein